MDEILTIQPAFMGYKKGSPEMIAYEKREAEEMRRYSEKVNEERRIALLEIEKQYKLGGAEAVYDNWYCNLEDNF